MNFQYNHELQIAYYENAHVGYTLEEYYLDICCYNVLHEIGHSICKEYSCILSLGNGVDTADSIFNEELLVNDFAASFWKKYGESTFICDIFKIKSKRKLQLENEQGKLMEPIYPGSFELIECNDYKTYYRNMAHLVGTSNELSVAPHGLDSQTYYDHFQTCSALESLEKNVTFEDVLLEMGVGRKVSFSSNETLIYSYYINTPLLVIGDVSRILNASGIEVPPIQYCNLLEKGNRMKFWKIN